MDITGQGVLWRAEGPDGRPAVVRFFARPLPTQLATRVEALLRLEGSAGSEYLANVRAVFTEDTRVAIVSDYLPAPTLQAALHADHVLSFNRRVQLARQLALAIACLHEGGLAHLDISPSNVLVTDDQAVLIDLLDTAGYTPGYAAPERVEAAEAGRQLELEDAMAADWWSWGAICHQLGIDLELAQQCLVPADQRPSRRQILNWCNQVDQRLPTAPLPLRLDDIVRTGAMSQATVRQRQRGRRRRPRAGQRKAVRPLSLVGAAICALAAIGVGVAWLSPQALSSAPAGERASGGTAVAPGRELAKTQPVGMNRGLAAESEPGQGEAVPPVCPTSAEAEASLRQLSNLRHRALESGDENLLADIYSSADAAPYRADVQLLQRLKAAHIEVSGLSTQIGQVKVECTHPVQVSFETAEESYQRCEDGQCVRQPAGERHCVQMKLEGPPWKIAEIGPGQCQQ